MKIKVEIWCDDPEELARVGKAVNDSVHSGQNQPFPKLPETVTQEYDPEYLKWKEEKRNKEIAEQMYPSAPVAASPVKQEEIFAVEAVEEVEQEEKPVEEPKTKRSRKTKAERQAELKVVKDEPVVTSPSVADTDDSVSDQAPHNFYSFSDFQNSFAIVLNKILKEGFLNQEDIEHYTKYYGLEFIYAIKTDPKKLEHFYNELVKKEIITKKGDY